MSEPRKIPAGGLNIATDAIGEIDTTTLGKLCSIDQLAFCGFALSIRLRRTNAKKRIIIYARTSLSLLDTRDCGGCHSPPGQLCRTKTVASRDRKTIAQTLKRFTDGLPNRSSLDWNAHLSDQIDGFLADINDVLHNEQLKSQRQLLRQRMSILDERRDYLQSLRFETACNVCQEHD